MFSSLVGGPGHYAVTPVDRFVPGGYYEAGSLIWRSRWVTSQGIVECREALASPGDRHRAVLLRRVEAREGAARVRVVLGPSGDFGRQPTAWTTVGPGRWDGRCGNLHLRWQAGAASWACADGTLEGVLEVPPLQHHDLVLEMSDQPLPATPPTADRTVRPGVGPRNTTGCSRPPAWRPCPAASRPGSGGAGNGPRYE